MTSIFLSARSANLLWMGLSLATTLSTNSLSAATRQIGAHTFTLPEGFKSKPWPRLTTSPGP